MMRLVARCILFSMFLAALVIWTTLAMAHEAMLRQFVVAYNAGSVEQMPLAEGARATGDTDAREQYAELFRLSKERRLVLRNVRWSDTRITADYATLVDGHMFAGSVTIYVENDQITRIEHDAEVWPEPTGTVYIAEYGQAADKITTAAVLMAGGVEMNPALASLSPAGMLVLGGALIALRQTWVREMPLSECIATTKWAAAAGWLGGANNLAVLAGVGPAALAVGAVAAVIAYQQDYKGACVDGDVRVAEIQ